MLSLKRVLALVAVHAFSLIALQGTSAAAAKPSTSSEQKTVTVAGRITTSGPHFY
jgi:hypothetical protein